MKDMLRFLITRDTMHQNQWLAIVNDLGGLESQLPIPNSFPQEEELSEFNYTFVGTRADGTPPPDSAATRGPSPDGKGQFRTEQIRAMGEEPKLAPPRPKSGAQKEQIQSDPDIVHRGINAVKDMLS